ncbi:MAG: L-threonylcarbamoyladenylate synthase [Bacteroidales bacterium]|nr:L-threonylcarbamoyladenylate synthase [Bacteroidales bacterium]
MKEIIAETIRVLNVGGVILYPTDTIWGLGCDPDNADAIASIYAIKQRVESKSMIVLVKDVKMLEKYVEQIPEVAYQLIEASTGPLTIIYPKAKNLNPNIVAPDGTIAVRIPKCEFCQQLLSEYNKPLVSTSANLTGQKPPLGFFDIVNEIKIAVDYIVPIRLNQLSSAKSSDIIKVFKSGKFDVVR